MIFAAQKARIQKSVAFGTGIKDFVGDIKYSPVDVAVEQLLASEMLTRF